MDSRERFEKTQYLVKTWIKEQGIDIQLENIQHSINFLIRSIYDKLPDGELGELHDSVSNYMEPKDN